MSTAVASPAPTKVGDSGRSSSTPVVSVRNAAAPNRVQLLIRPINQAAVMKRTPVRAQTSLRLSAPNDPAEKEAAATARKIMRMQVPESSVSYLSTGTGGLFREFRKEDRDDKLKRQEPAIRRSANPSILTKRPEEERKIQRQAEGQSSVNSNVAANIQNNMADGAPLPMTARKFMEPRFGADFSGVRIHTGAESASLNRQLNAQAFAVSNHIFFGKDKLNPESHEGQELIAHELTHTIQQGAAVQRSEEVSVRQQTPTQVQRLGISDALNYFADKANLIPGFRMFTIILGVNPINMSGVDRSAANILRALVEFIPGGGLIVEALDNNGVFDKVGNWVEQQIKTLGMTGSAIKQAVTQFLDSLGWSDIFNLGGVWDRAKRIFTEPIDRIISFAKGLVTGIITFIKDAILMPLAKLAEGTRGWDLLIAVLGRNPITGEAVPRTAETLIPGFLKLIGQEEVWENMKKANALGRAWAWFQGAMNALIGFVSQIPTLAMNTFKSLELFDIVVVPRAFAKVAAVFGNFIGNFITWAGTAVWNLLEIIFEVLAPSVMPYVAKAKAAFKTILKDPIAFVGNLVRAGKLGFQMFASNILEHLKAALIKWITGPLGDAGVYIPKSFSLMEIVKLVLSVLGLTWQNIRSKLVKIIPEPVLVGLEKTAGILVTLVKDGPAAAWEQIKAELSELKDQLIAQVTQMVTTEVVKAAVVKLVSMLNPAGAVVQAIIAIYNTVTFFIEKINQIAAVVASFIDSISAIASGQVENAAKKVEQTMANTLTVIIAFLAKFAGAGNIPNKVVGIVKKIRQPIDKGLDKIVGWLGNILKKAGTAVAQAGLPQDPNERLRLAAQAATAAARRLSGRMTVGLVQPVLRGIQIRYGLREIVPYEQGGRWWVKATINPTITQDLGVPTGSVPSETGPAGASVAGAAPTGAATWPVAVGANIRIPETSRIERVLSLNPNDTITYTAGTGRVTTGRDAFMRLWNAQRIRLGGDMSADEKRQELTRLYGATVADAIMRRSELADNVAVLNLQQAHHVLPIELLGQQGMLRLLVNSGWDYNSAINGVALDEGFHGSHPQYTRYVSVQITNWVQQHGTSKVAEFRTWVEGTLIPHLSGLIATARRQFGTTGQNLNDYFATL